MKRDCIKDFIEAWKAYDNPDDPRVPPWNMRFQDTGYYCVDLNDHQAWSVCYDWCKENIGEKHYAWFGKTFWFENEQDAVLFRLRWG